MPSLLLRISSSPIRSSSFSSAISSGEKQAMECISGKGFCSKVNLSSRLWAIFSAMLAQCASWSPGSLDLGGLSAVLRVV